ncbi:MAG TPA: amidohydrolase family protein [Thermoanaerobaculia bacterium]|nr:amidohydrolase family protein [Thermoanaerobaculia bacterium]
MTPHPLAPSPIPPSTLPGRGGIGKVVAACAFALAATLPAHAETIVITNAEIHTMGSQGTIKNGTLVIENGKIRAVGAAVPLPASSSRHIDAHGKPVTPGLIDSNSQIGLVEVSAVDGTEDAHSQDDQITASFNVADAFNPRSILIPVNRVEGLTRIVASPGPGKTAISGQGAVIDLAGPGEGSHPNDYIVRSPAAMFAVLGETGAGLVGGARQDALLLLREAFQDTLDYTANHKNFEQGNRRAYALSRLDLEALVPVVKGELPLVIAVDRASDIETALRLAKDFHLKLILASAAEGWKVARQIADAKVPVLLRATNNLPQSFESLGATLENPARLYKAGVTIAFMSGDAHNSRNIRQDAGNAVAYGLPWDAALAAMTSVPAHIWGIADHYGTLEPGQDADVVIWDGDPLEVTSFPTAVFIRGKAIPMTNRQLELRDRYKDLKGPVPPVSRKP